MINEAIASLERTLESGDAVMNGRQNWSGGNFRAQHVRALISEVKQLRDGVSVTQMVGRVRDHRQWTVFDWIARAFLQQDGDTRTRSLRFLEESTELVQATGLTHDEALRVVNYVYGRDVGEPHQEIGGVMVTLYGLAESLHLSVDKCECVEIDRILAKPIDHFHGRQQEKRAAGL